MWPCERCGALPSNPFGLHDYCAECSKNLCDECMAEGCCGNKPALSGMKADCSEEEEEEAIEGETDG